MVDDSENGVQEQLFDYLETCVVDGLSVRAHSYAVPNGMQIAGGPKSRGKYMNAMKRRGLTPGVSDVVIAIPRGVYHGMYLEVKKTAKSPVGADQADWRARMQEQGYYAVIAAGWDRVKSEVDHYLRLGRFVSTTQE